MSKNNTWIVVLTLILLCLLSWFYGKKYLEQKPKLTGYAAVTANINLDRINSFELIKGDKTLKFVKETTEWKVNQENKADGLAIQAFLSAIISPRNVDIVAETDKKLTEFGLDDETRTKLKLYDEVNEAGLKLELWLGNNNRMGRYVKLENQNNIYLLYDVPENSKSMEIDSWMEKISNNSN